MAPQQAIMGELPCRTGCGGSSLPVGGGLGQAPVMRYRRAEPLVQMRNLDDTNFVLHEFRVD